MVYWVSSRLVKYVGKDGAISAKYLEGADIKNGSDIRIEGGSSLPQSKAGRIALFMDLMTNGVLPPQDALKLMKIPSMQAYWDQVDIDENQALRENVAMSELDPIQLQQARAQVDQIAQQKLMEGNFDPEQLGDPMGNPIAAQELEVVNQPVFEVHEWDNHEVHLKVIENFMKGQEFETLNPAVQEEFKLHRQAHKDMLFKTMFEENMKAQMGAPPEGGAPTDPNAEGGGELGANQFSGIEEPPPPVDSAAAPV